MPTKIKPRSPTTGVTNKSQQSLHATTKHASVGGKQCICKSCTCGKHSCVERSRMSNIRSNQSDIPLSGSSETHDQYHGYALPETHSFKPSYQAIPKRDIENATESRAQYVSKPVPPRPKPHTRPYEVNNAKLEGSSETKDQYHAHQLNVRKAIKPEYQAPARRDLESQTESAQQYVQKATPPRPKPHQRPYEKNEAPLSGHSETADAFKVLEITPRKDFKPVYEKPQKRDIETSTESSSQYVGKEVPPRPQLHSRKYEPNPAKFEGQSEVTEAYKAWPSQGAPAKYKKNDYKPSDTKLLGESITKSDFHDHVYQAPIHATKTPSEYKPPTGDLATSSVYKDQFKPYAELHSPAKHQRELMATVPESRDFKSVSSEAYQPYAAADVHVPLKRKQEYIVSPFKLEGESINKSDYHAHDMSSIQRTNLKQAALNDRQGHMAATSNAQFAKGTEYNERYLAKVGPVERVHAIRPAPAEIGTKIPLLGESELHQSYKDPATVSSLGAHVYDRVASYAPSHKRERVKDDRDFSSVTGTSFDATKLTSCPVSSRMSKGKSVGEDGHVYILESVDNLAQQ